jgi:ParB family transcriptional regulator, chromosome partitioning protein
MSATPRRGLGSGLGALLGDEASASVRPVPVVQIRPNPQQPRTNFDAAGLEELRRSIADLGVLVPIIVRRRDDGFELIAGERRWRAAVAAGLETIPAIVRDADDRESLEVAIVENLQRENLDPLEEAMGFQHLIDNYGLTQDQIAERVGKGRPTVANALRLLGLSQTIKASLRSGSLTPGHAKALLSLPESERELFARTIVARGLSVRAAEALVQRRRAPRTPVAAKPSKDVDAVVNRLRYRFGTHVSIVGRGAGGVIEIRYADQGDLTRIVDLLLDQ